MSSKRSKVHPKHETKYRVKNWAVYDRALVTRGDITLWITPEALEAWRPARTGSRGAQPKFSDVAIETARTLRIVFHLPLRQAEGFLRSIQRSTCVPSPTRARSICSSTAAGWLPSARANGRP